MDRSEIISELKSVTNCSDSEAAFYLEAADYDLGRAVAMFYGERPLHSSPEPNCFTFTIFPAK